MLVTKTEYARVLGRDVRSLKLPTPVEYLITNGKPVALYRHPNAEEIAAAIAVHMGVKHSNQNKVQL